MNQSEALTFSLTSVFLSFLRSRTLKISRENESENVRKPNTVTTQPVKRELFAEFFSRECYRYRCLYISRKRRHSLKQKKKEEEERCIRSSQ